ncbi:hypothetical protein BC937DRAFT_86438, partial [Endogone sp. FLAS-F59071]
MLQSSTFFEHPERSWAIDNTEFYSEIDLADEIKSRTLLHWAASNGYIDIVKLLAVEFHMDINAQSALGVRPI